MSGSCKAEAVQCYKSEISIFGETLPGRFFRKPNSQVNDKKKKKKKKKLAKCMPINNIFPEDTLILTVI